MVTRQELLYELPPYQDSWQLVKNEQSVQDIIKSVLQSHKEFAGYYDLIAYHFIGNTIEETADNLYWFCKNNIRYQEETEEEQTTALPTGLLTRGFGDCKHYASFIGGCLDAIARETGQQIDWCYCFASYKLTQQIPYHVFIVIETEQGPLWIDPTPGSEGKKPVWVVNKKVKAPKNMALIKNIAGFDSVELKSSLGAVSSLNVPAATLPVPDGYPGYLPRPYIREGLLQLTPVPPNFMPSNMDLAYILLALQLWVATYSETKFNVLTYNTQYDGSGLSMADFIIRFCVSFRDPAYYKNGVYGQYVSQAPSKANGYSTKPVFVPYDFANNYAGLKSQPYKMIWAWQLENFDFSAPPETQEKSWIDTVGVIAQAVNQVMMKYVSQLAPGVGTIFANAYNKAMNQPGIDAANQAGTIQHDIQQIIQNQQPGTSKESNTKKYLLYAAAGLLVIYFLFKDEIDKDG